MGNECSSCVPTLAEEDNLEVRYANYVIQNTKTQQITDFKMSELKNSSKNDVNISEKCEEKSTWVKTAEKMKEVNYKALVHNYENNVPLLLVNLLMMSVQFFKNFERDKKYTVQRRKSMEESMSEKLKHLRQRVYISNEIFDTISNYVGFKEKYSGLPEPLAPLNIHIIFDNISLQKYEDFDYLRRESLDSTSSSKDLKVCVRHLRDPVGLCHLIVVNDHFENEITSNHSIASSNTDLSESLEFPSPNFSDSDSLFNIPSSAPHTDFPSKVFTHFSLPDIDQDSDHRPQHTFISSLGFRKNFERLGISYTLNALGLVDSNTSVKISGGIIRIKRLLNELSEDFVWTLSPSFEASWSSQESLDWLIRQNEEYEDKKTSTLYVWPSKETKDAIRRLGLNLSPSCKNVKNLNSPIKNNCWSLTFFKYERLLINTLSYTQLRLYIYSVLLYRNFTKDLKPLEEQHFKYELFYLLEEIPAGPIWFEENLGESLVLLLSRLSRKLTHYKFKHYFMSRKNTFEGYSQSSLHKVSANISKLLNHLSLHLLASFQKLEIKNETYPVLDITRLYNIMTAKNSELLLYSRPELQSCGSNSEEERKEIDVTLTFNKFSNSTQARLILELFTEHFVSMAKKSNFHRNFGQGLMYTFQAQNLLKLMENKNLNDTLIWQSLNSETLELRELRRGNKKDYWTHNLGPNNYLSSESFKSSNFEFQSSTFDSSSEEKTNNSKLSSQL